MSFDFSSDFVCLPESDSWFDPDTDFVYDLDMGDLVEIDVEDIDLVTQLGALARGEY